MAHTNSDSAGESGWTHGFAQSGDVRIHYVTAGTGPLIVLIHGFPDFWYTWRHQIPELAQHFQVVAIDQRGYNESDQPAGVENYSISRLTADVKAVIDHFARPNAVIVGHDWGGAVAWEFAMRYPELTARLAVLGTPHPWALRRELATNPAQFHCSRYARDYLLPDASQKLTPENLASWVTDPVARLRYVEAFTRSSAEGMLNYYKAGFPREPYVVPDGAPPLIRCPVLVIHGARDPFLLSSGHTAVWEWLEEDFTFHLLSRSGHFLQQEQPEVVNRLLLNWLDHGRNDRPGLRD